MDLLAWFEFVVSGLGLVFRLSFRLGVFLGQLWRGYTKTNTGSLDFSKKIQNTDIKSGIDHKSN